LQQGHGAPSLDAACTVIAGDPISPLSVKHNSHIVKRDNLEASAMPTRIESARRFSSYASAFGIKTEYDFHTVVRGSAMA
jgi:hypothetical protein